MKVKRILLVLVALILLLGLSACGKKSKKDYDLSIFNDPNPPEVVTPSNIRDAEEELTDFVSKFSTALKDADCSAILKYMNLDDNYVVSVQDVEDFISESACLQLVGASKIYAKEYNNSEDGLASLVTLSGNGADVDVNFRKVNDEWSVVFDNFPVELKRISVPSVEKLTIDNKVFDTTKIGTDDERRGYGSRIIELYLPDRELTYAIESEVFGVFEGVIQESSRDDVDMYILPTISEETFNEISKDITNAFNSMFSKAIEEETMNMQDIQEYFSSESQYENIEPMFKLLTAIKNKENTEVGYVNKMFTYNKMQISGMTPFVDDDGEVYVYPLSSKTARIVFNCDLLTDSEQNADGIGRENYIFHAQCLDLIVEYQGDAWKILGFGDNFFYNLFSNKTYL